MEARARTRSPWISALAVALASCRSDPASTGVRCGGGKCDEVGAEVTPLRYALDLTVEPAAARFSGRVSITVDVTAATDRIALHGRGLDVSAARVVDGGGAVIAASWSAGDDGVATLALAHPAAPGEGRLELEWSAPFDEAMSGLFRFHGPDGAAYAATRLEPIDARRVFPGFDHPRWKTPFALSLTVPAGDLAFANTPEVSAVEIEGGLIRRDFAETPPLPAYLLAWVVGPLDVVAGPTLDATAARPALAVRGIAPRGMAGEMGPLLALAPVTIGAMEQYAGVAFPFAKLDYVSIPGGPGMGNAGLISLPSDLFFDPATATISDRHRAESVFKHETRHQWFGDLVTMDDWSDTWLNEGTATWSGKLDLGDSASGFVSSLGQMMDRDSVATALPVRVPIASDAEIDDAFSTVVYAKGAAVLTMLEHYMGFEAFRAGMNDYLTANAWTSVGSDELRASLAGATPLAIDGIFDSFVTQPGVPYVRAEVQCDGEAGALLASQRRYVAIGAEVDTGLSWHIPLCVAYGRGGDRRVTCSLLDQASEQSPLEFCPEWLMPNADAQGYYRFELTGQGLRDLLRDGFAFLSRLERIAIGDSVDAGFRAASLAAADVLDALPVLAGTADATVASKPFRTLELLDKAVIEGATRPPFGAYVADLYRGHYDALGWDAGPDTDADEAALRAKAVWAMAQLADDAGARAEAIARAHAFVGLGGDGALHLEALAPDLRETALTVAARHGDDALFDRIETHLLASSDASLRRILLTALASFRDPSLADRARQFLLDPRFALLETATIVSVQNVDEHLRDGIWTFYRDNYAALQASLPASAAAAGPMLSVRGACSRAHADRVEAFFADPAQDIAGVPGASHLLDTELAVVRACAAQADAHRAAVTAYFTP